MRVLLLDIETAPNIAYVWGLWDQNINHEQLVESSYVMCWSAMWLDGDEIMFASDFQNKSPKKMLKPIHKLLEEADVVIHYYGTKFDIPVLNRELVRHGFLPPSPYKQVDLKLAVARVFKFESTKLAYVADRLGLTAKVKHIGFQLWVKCMNGDHEAQKSMETYNRGDVVTLLELYNRLLPWLPNHPNRSAYDGQVCCPRCGGFDHQKRGVATAVTRTYQRYRCNACGGWFRGTETLSERGMKLMTNIGAA